MHAIKLYVNQPELPGCLWTSPAGLTSGLQFKEEHAYYICWLKQIKGSLDLCLYIVLCGGIFLFNICVVGIWKCWFCTGLYWQVSTPKKSHTLSYHLFKKHMDTRCYKKYCRFLEGNLSSFIIICMCMYDTKDVIGIISVF